MFLSTKLLSKKKASPFNSDKLNSHNKLTSQKLKADSKIKKKIGSQNRKEEKKNILTNVSQNELTIVKDNNVNSFIITTESKEYSQTQLNNVQKEEKFHESLMNSSLSDIPAVSNSISKNGFSTFFEIIRNQSFFINSKESLNYLYNPSTLNKHSIHLFQTNSSNVFEVHNFNYELKDNSTNSFSQNEIPKKPIFFIRKINKVSKMQIKSSILDIENHKITLNKIKKLFNDNVKLILQSFEKEGIEILALNDIPSIVKVIEIFHQQKHLIYPQQLFKSKNIKGKKKYNIFTPEAKRFCVDLYSKYNMSLRDIVIMCNISKKSLKRWIHLGCSRKKGCGRKIRDKEMESKLKNWYILNRLNNMKITGTMLKKKALEFSSYQNFKASSGWLEKFVKKYQLHLDYCKENKNNK